MARTEEKARIWTLHNVFVQANTIRGYRYLDLSGVVLNRIAKNYVRYAIEPSGCVLIEPNDSHVPYSVRFSSERIWLQYRDIESLNHVVDTAPEWIRSIAQDVQVNRFSRLGFRSVYFIPSNDWVNDTSALAQLMTGEILRDKITQTVDAETLRFEYGLRIPSGNLYIHIRINAVGPIGDEGGETGYPSAGIVFDLDIFMRDSKGPGIPRRETNKFVVAAKDKIQEYLEDIGSKILGVLNG